MKKLTYSFSSIGEGWDEVENVQEKALFTPLRQLPDFPSQGR